MATYPQIAIGVNYILGVNARTKHDKVDLTSFVEFVSLKQNLFAEREDANMVTLSGRLSTPNRQA